ncbi:putative ribonuclease H-like domain-containing protein, partial [Tanacetum coccineum]
SLLPTTFWAEAVNTASYVQNRVLVTKPHNKTPYELLLGRPPCINFMRPFGCPVTILNTLDPLGKFDGKADEGFFVGYSINSKAFRLRPQSLEDAVADDAEGGASNKEDDQNVQDFRVALDNLLVKQKKSYTNSTNRDSTVSPCVSTAGQNFTNADDLPTDPLMPDLENTADLLNTGIFSGAYDDEDVGAEANLNNLETTMNVSPIPTTRIHKDHPKDQIIREINSATQTRKMTEISEELSMMVTQALTDPSWIEVMQDELLQFRLQKVWRLVDLPKGKHAIGTKWVYRNKKDERGIVVRNKAILSALYDTIKEEVYVCQPPGFEDSQFLDKVYKVEKALYGLHQAPKACGDPNHLIGECLKPPRDKNQRAFVGGSWSDSGEENDEKIQDETCLVAQAPNEGKIMKEFSCLIRQKKFGKLCLKALDEGYSSKNYVRKFLIALHPKWRAGNGYQTKGLKESQKQQSQARNGKDKVKSRPKSVKVKKSTGKSTPSKSKDSQVEKIQLEGLKLPNLKLYYKNRKTRDENANWVQYNFKGQFCQAPKVVL